MTSPGWHLDERALAGDEHLDPAYVVAYDGKTGAGAEEELELLRAHGPCTETSPVDLGAGTGHAALAAAFSWLPEPMLERADLEIREASHRRGQHATCACARRP